jgi:hypothetical protein
LRSEASERQWSGALLGRGIVAVLPIMLQLRANRCIWSDISLFFKEPGRVTFEPQGPAIDREREPASAPFVVDVVGEVEPHGRAIALRIQRSEQGPVDLCLRSEDLQYFVSLILALAHEAKRLQPAGDDDPPPSATIPLPVTAINVGQTTDDNSFVMLDVGFVSLTFGVPEAYLEKIGRTLLAMSARAPTRPS